MNEPHISVIMATFNSENFIKYSIQSVICQTVTNFELIVIGDCCNDGTEQVVKSFNEPRIKWYNLPKRVGSQGLPNKEGLKIAKGEYVAYLGHDDLWFPWHLEKSLQYLTEYNLDFVHSAGFGIRPRSIDCIGVAPPNMPYPMYLLGPSSWFHRRGVPERVGNWLDHRVCLTFVDVEMHGRMVRGGIKMGLNSEISIIKFPAPDWKIFSKELTSFPQEEASQKLLTNPISYHCELLKKVAYSQGQMYVQRRRGLFSLYELLIMATWRPFRRWNRHLVLNIAVSKWRLLKRILVWSMLRARRKRAKKTGEIDHLKSLANTVAHNL